MADETGPALTRVEFTRTGRWQAYQGSVHLADEASPHRTLCGVRDTSDGRGGRYRPKGGRLDRTTRSVTCQRCLRYAGPLPRPDELADRLEFILPPREPTDG